VDLTLTDDQVMLADTAAAFVARECSRERVRAIEASAQWYDRAMWDAMAELGWCALALPEAHDGAGQGLLDVTILAEQLGRGPVPTPLVTSTVTARAIADLGTDEQRARLLPPLADGRMIGTFAVMEPGMSDPWGELSQAGTAELSGDKLLVPWADVAAVLLVATADGLWMVERERAGWDCERHDAFTGDPVFAVRLDRAAAEPLHAPDASSAARRVLDAMAVVQLGYAVGAAEGCLDLSIRQASDRVQFGRPIGAFQAVAHRCAEMRAEIDACRYLAYQAAWALDRDRDPELAVTAALTYARGALRRVFLHAHQVHGASGFATEQDLHLLTRRLNAFQITYTSSPHHADRLATEIGLR